MEREQTTIRLPSKLMEKLKQEAEKKLTFELFIPVTSDCSVEMFF